MNDHARQQLWDLRAEKIERISVEDLTEVMGKKSTWVCRSDLARENIELDFITDTVLVSDILFNDYPK